MSGFEALFSFYGLLLGLAIASVATGFGEMWRGRARRRIGVLLPLFGLVVLFATTQQWLSLWRAQPSLTITAATLLISLAMALPYGFAAQAMFPTADDAVEHGDAHYLHSRRALLTAIAIPLLVSLIYNAIRNWAAMSFTDRDFAIRCLVPLATIGALAAVASKRVQVTGLLILIACRLFAMF